MKTGCSFNAEINLSEGLAGSKLSGRVDIPNLASAGRYISLEGLPQLPASIKAELALSASGLSFKLSDSKLGDMAVDLEGTLHDLQKPDNIFANFQVAVPSLRNIPLYPQAQNLPDLPGVVSGQVEYRDEQIHLTQVAGSFGRSKFEFEALVTTEEKFTGSHIEFEISGPDFKPLLPIDTLAFLPGKFRASGRVEKGAVADRLKDLELDLGDMRARVNGTVDDLTRLTSADLFASVSLPSMSELDGFLNQDFPDFPFSMEVSFSGTGSQFTLDPLKTNLGPNDLSGKISIDLKDRPHH